MSLSLSAACQAVPKMLGQRDLCNIIARCRTNVDIILLNFLQTHSKLTEVSFGGFIESPAWVHKIVFYGAR